VAIVALLVIASGEGMAVFSLYTENASITHQLTSLQAGVGRGQGYYPMALVDDANRTVTLLREPQRVVSLEPSDSQIVFGIGEGSKLVGATSYDDWPTDLTSAIGAGKVTVVGGTLSDSINVESVIGLSPDLVLAWGEGGEQTQTIQQLSDAGVPVLVLSSENMGQIYSDILLVGRALDANQNATNLVSEMKTVVSYVSSRVAGTSSPSVFYEVWNDPLITAGPDSFVGQLIGIAGGRNIFSNVTEQYPTVSAEAVVSLDPQVVIATAEINMTSAQLAHQPGFQATSAAANGRFYVLAQSGQVQEPGPRLLEGLFVLASMIHPEEFPAPTAGVVNDATGQLNETAVAGLR
jgi:iron complex transport system substrate-binding protein